MEVIKKRGRQRKLLETFENTKSCHFSISERIAYTHYESKLNYNINNPTSSLDSFGVNGLDCVCSLSQHLFKENSTFFNQAQHKITFKMVFVQCLA